MTWLVLLNSLPQYYVYANVNFSTSLYFSLQLCNDLVTVNKTKANGKINFYRKPHKYLLYVYVNFM